MITNGRYGAEERKLVADELRRLADELERDDACEVDYAARCEYVDKPRTWRDGGAFRGRDLVAKTVEISMRWPGGKKR